MTKGPAPACYDCRHRRLVVGSTHSRCAHPLVEPGDEFEMIARAVTGHYKETARKLNVVGDEMGTRNGWFVWPADFDPVWLRSCDGFESETPDEDTIDEL